jgi:hypothetical protein
MPSLAGVASALGVPYTTPAGIQVRATVRPPPPVGAAFEGAMTPRHSIVVAPDSILPLVGELADSFGNRFLHAEWGREGLMLSPSARTHVLFPITGEEPWTRNSFTTEPISGQRIVGTPTALGVIAVVREFIRRENDALDIVGEVYRVLCTRSLEVGDFLDGRRVRRVESVLGLTYAEVA